MSSALATSVEQVAAGLLDVGYVDAGPRDGRAVVLLHGWPYDIHTFGQVSPLLAAAGYRVIVPYLRGHGTTRFLSEETFRNGQQSVLAVDTVALMDALGIETAIVAGADWGARTADVVAALWPERCAGLVSVSGYLIGSQRAGELPLAPEAERQWWYQFYFATERGRAGYERYRREFARLIWRSASPQWDFDDATFERSAAALDNPDHVAIVIHNYRWRIGLGDGEPQYDPLERRLAEAPVISVPTITLEGDANGAPHPDPGSYAGKFSGPHSHRTITGGIGHNLPQEAPEAFAQAVIDVNTHCKELMSEATSNAPLTVVLVHGAFADASSWDGVIERLQAAGSQVTAAPNPLRGISYDSAYVAGFMKQVPGPVLAVGHSYGGAVISNAATGLDNVIGLVFVAAFAPDEGERLGEVTAGSSDSRLGTAQVALQYPTPDGAGTATEFAIDPAKLHDVFAADLPAQQAAVMAVTQRPVSELAFTEPSGPPAWKSLPSWTVLASPDKAAGTDVVRSMAERAGATVTEVEGSHVIMISRPDVVADVIQTAAAAVSRPLATRAG